MRQIQDSRQRIKEFEEQNRYGVMDLLDKRGPEDAKEYQYTYTLGNLVSVSGWKSSIDSAKIEAANDFVAQLRAAGYIN